jgi:hypothetical protein
VRVLARPLHAPRPPPVVLPLCLSRLPAYATLWPITHRSCKTSMLRQSTGRLAMGLARPPYSYTLAPSVAVSFSLGWWVRTPPSRVRTSWGLWRASTLTIRTRGQNHRG